MFGLYFVLSPDPRGVWAKGANHTTHSLPSSIDDGDDGCGYGSALVTCVLFCIGKCINYFLICKI